MPKINREEYEVLKEAQEEGYKWIARNYNGALIIYTSKPMKNPNLYWDDFGKRMDDRLFKFIQWEDEEPYNIAELIEEYESEETEVKKDIEWLRKDFDRIIDQSVRISPDKEWDRGWNLAWHEARSAVHALTNQLDEPEVLSQEWIYENAIEFYADTADAEVHVVFRMRDLQNLLVPKQELAVVPQFVADWYENHRDNLEKQLQGIAYNLDRYGRMPEVSDLDKWINETECPVQTLASLEFGYEVEEEQKYFAKIKGHENIGSDDKYWNYCITDESLDIGDNKVHADVLAEYVLNATKDEWENLGINDDNADFIKVEELEE